MERYIAVDSGKGNTKVAIYNPQKDIIKQLSFATKIGEGLFEDDAIEAGTMIVEINGKVYKVGNGAKRGAELTTSKKTEIHKVCTLAGIALCVSDSEEDQVTVAIGMPVEDFKNVEKRQEYKSFILPDGSIEVKMKTKSEGEIITKRFQIVYKCVYAESSGVTYLDPVGSKDMMVGVIDLGNLNMNATVWDNFELDDGLSFTDEMGGSALIAGLSQQISSKFSRVNEPYMLKVLVRGAADHDARKLIPHNPDPAVEKDSLDFIDQYLMDFVMELKRKCDARRWSLDYMKLAFIGGTAKLLEREIRKVFGENVAIYDEPEFVNVTGFLKRLCALKLNKVISLERAEKSTPDRTQDDRGKEKKTA